MGDDAEAPVPGAGLNDRAIVRAGDTVRRPAGRWTGSVQHMLRWLREHGFDLAPQPLGIDSADREVIAFIEGRDQGWPFIPEILSAGGAESLLPRTAPGPPPISANIRRLPDNEPWPLPMILFTSNAAAATRCTTKGMW